MRHAWIPVAGDQIAGQYEVEGTLGQGSAGVVLAARHARTGGAVAIKWLLPSNNSELVQRFITEARVIARIEHPNVIQLYDFGEDRGCPFIVTERLRGESLRTRLDRGGPMDEAEAIRRLVPAMRGVAEAHREGVVHRDLKPDNIFLCQSKDGRPLPSKVLDFGIAKLFDESGDPLTGTGMMVGTPHYMSPQQLKSPRDIDVRFDVYALGVVLFEALIGRCPFHADGIYALIAQIMTHDTPRLAALLPDVSPRIDAAVARAMAREQDDRFPNVETFIAAIEGEAERSTPSRARRVIPPTAIGPSPGERAAAPPPPPASPAPPFAVAPKAKPAPIPRSTPVVAPASGPITPPAPAPSRVDAFGATNAGFAEPPPPTVVLPEEPAAAVDAAEWESEVPTDVSDSEPPPAPSAAPPREPPPSEERPKPGWSPVRTARTVVLGEPPER